MISLYSNEVNYIINSGPVVPKLGAMNF
jgi:hypothetical protein